MSSVKEVFNNVLDYDYPAEFVCSGCGIIIETIYYNTDDLPNQHEFDYMIKFCPVCGGKVKNG